MFGRIGVCHALKLRRSLLAAADVLGTADQRPASMMVPVPQLVPDRKALPAAVARTVHPDDRAATVTDDACLTAVQVAALDPGAQVPSDCFKVNFARISDAQVAQDSFGWRQ